MNMKTVIPLGLALVLGLIAAILVKNTMSHRNLPVPSNANGVTVVVAKQDVDPGKAIEKEDLTIAHVPAEVAPSHVFSDPAQLVGRVAIAPLSRGQTIMESLLAPTGTGSGLQALIPPGLRAVTIEVNEFSGVGGMLEPGCRVDLVSTLNDPKTHEQMSKTILQYIKILAIGRSTTPPHPVEGQPAPPPSNNVTLLVTPKEAQVLELACSSGRPWLVLRYGNDNANVSVEPTALHYLRGDPDSPDSNTVAAPPSQNPVSAPVASTPFSPVPDATQDERPTTEHWTVTCIRGGAEQKTNFTIPLARPDTAGTNDQQAPAAGQQ
jgi:pilus assembly protein CpaB